jgi:protoporphyrinogen IX oxidase
MELLLGWLQSTYPWIKAAHVVFVIFWVAGLFMLPRFLVYQQEAAQGSPEDKAWTERNRRLLSIILKPSLLVVWALGLALVLTIGAGQATWFHIKFAVVLGLTLYQFWMTSYAAKLARGQRTVSGRTLRLLNEVPSLATIAIVILVIVKPF